MLVHHYTTSYEAIKADGVIKTELQVNASLDDGLGMDYVWLTSNNTMAHASHSLKLAFMRNVAKGIAMYGEQLFAQIEDMPIKSGHKFTRITFDSKDIGAHAWTSERKRFAGSSVKRSNLVRDIDARSKFNGDDVREYYVTKHAIDINKAVEITTVDTTLDTLFWSLTKATTKLGAFVEWQKKFNKKLL